MTSERFSLAVPLLSALLCAFPALVQASDAGPATLTLPPPVVLAPKVAVPLPDKSAKPRTAAAATREEPLVSSSSALKITEKAPPGERESAAESIKGDEALRKMLIERIAESGQVVLRSSDGEPTQASRPVVKRKPKTLLPADLETSKRQALVPEGGVPWGYAGAGGPDRWAQLQSGFELCAKGQRQSPIDIRQGISVTLDPIEFDYRPGTVRVLDNGHTIQVAPVRGSAIQVMGKRYELQHIEFHRPSEERVEGRAFDMGMHLVHRDLDGRLAVVAVLLTEGSANPEVQLVWNNWPLERQTDVVPSAPMDLNKLLPEDRRYITYMGSLTTPPCTEGVLWMVLKAPVQISAEQIAIFAHLYPMNARPVQPTNGRLIKDGR